MSNNEMPDKFSKATQLIENAIDFASRAVDELQENPKHSVINFYAAVELFLKARLVQEHWSLVVARDPDLRKFEAGEFVSVTFDEACIRLERIVQSPISESAKRNFDVVRRHRNRMVHFYPDAGAKSIETIAKEQLRAWYDLNQLLMSEWEPFFRERAAKINTIQEKLSGHRAYLAEKFQALSREITALRNKGIKIERCLSCSFQSAQAQSIIGTLQRSSCLVCDYEDIRMEHECNECGESSVLRQGGDFECAYCDYTSSHADLATEINQFVATKDNYLGCDVPANCIECGGINTVVEYESKYLCVCCFEIVDSLYHCGWCSHGSNGEIKDSEWKGCEVCDGRAGWIRDDD